MDRLNEEFRRLANECQWPQAKIARELLTTPATVSRYLSGKMPPSGPVLRLFAMLIGQPLTIDIEGESVTIKDQPPSLESWEMMFLAKIRRLPYRKRQLALEQIIGLLDTLADSEPGPKYPPSAADSFEPEPISDSAMTEVSTRALAKDATRKASLHTGAKQKAGMPTGTAASPNAVVRSKSNVRQSPQDPALKKHVA